MNSLRKINLLLIIIIAITLVTFQIFESKLENQAIVKQSKHISSSSPKAPVSLKKARSEYFFKLLRDPKTNKIPDDIRRKELQFAKNLDKLNRLNKIQSANFTWDEAGPNDVGGRTRALAIDLNNSNVIIAGGASGGIWKSSDNGASWKIKTSSEQLIAVTSIAQDSRSGFRNLWYASTGEFVGSSASDRGYTAFYSGTGIYKSTDNGETWFLLSNTSSNPTSFDSYYDYVSKITVSPVTGSVFIASNATGILKSSNGGSSFSIVLGKANDHSYSDIIALPNGNLVAVISQAGFNSTKLNSPGVYTSTNDGDSWNNITPSSFPTSHARSVLGASNSDPNLVYVLTYTGTHDTNGNEIIKLHKINLFSGTSTDLSANLPNFSEPGGKINSQSNYNLAIAVKPDDPSLVLIGGTSLFRSFDGFSTPLNDKAQNWIGGYNPNINNRSYPNHHPDQHALVFDPFDSKKLWSGHDGGLSYTSDITNTNYTSTFPWVDKNNGYNVTQFYSVSLAKNAGDNRIMGGTQDNGTPFFTRINQVTSSTSDLSSGDGGYSYFGTDYAYVSSQMGSVTRIAYKSNGVPYNPFTDGLGWSEITPTGASNQLFINPFVIDPIDENVMYYPAGNTLWRNNALSSIPNFKSGTSIGWAQLSNLNVPSGYNITAITVSTNNPSHILYYGASGDNVVPKLYKLNNSNTSTNGAIDISISSAVSNSYVHNISVNPNNGNEILVLFSNYNITGLYYSNDGGSNFIAVEGNLTGTSNNPGPSLRSSTILPTTGGTLYIVGTSTGLYYTTFLNGDNTTWANLSLDKIGNSVIEYVTSRTSDNRIAVGTHGRGIFIGDLNGTVDVKKDYVPKNFKLYQNYPNPFNPSTVISYQIPNSVKVTLKIFDVLGNEVAILVDGIKPAGNYNVQFDASQLASGLYIYRLQAGNYVQQKKMMLLK